MTQIAELASRKADAPYWHRYDIEARNVRPATRGLEQQLLARERVGEATNGEQQVRSVERAIDGGDCHGVQRDCNARQRAACRLRNYRAALANATAQVFADSRGVRCVRRIGEAVALQRGDVACEVP